ncbi:MAG: MerC domain-containing protein [Acidobacteriota bacterium]
MERPKSFNLRAIADGFGIFGAAACAIHCIAIPVLLVVGAAVPSLFLGETFHRTMLWLVVPSAILAFSLGCSRHKDRLVLILGAVGVIGLVASGTVLHDVVGEFGEKAGTLASAAILIFAHVRNFRLCRSDSCET